VTPGRLDAEAKAGQQPAQGIAAAKSEYSDQYLFGQLSGVLIRELVRADAAADASSGRAIYRIWPDFAVKMFTNQSIKTIKADAARNAFGALGEDIVWAVIDTGIDGAHPHFQAYKNLASPVGHRDFSASLEEDDATSAKAALESDTRTLAFEAGRKFGVRINTISAGPLASRAASAIGIIERMVEYVSVNAPLTQKLEAAEVGSVAVFLASPLASGITGNTVYVDKGYHAMGMAVSAPAS